MCNDNSHAVLPADQMNPETHYLGNRPRMRGVVEKCTFCVHRLQKAKEQAKHEGRNLRENDFQPAGAESCPAGAIAFGDLENESHRVNQLSHSPRATKLLEDLGTEPKVIYLKEVD